MSKNLIIAMILIALTVVVLLLNARGTATVELGVMDGIKASAAMIYLGFTAIGVVIGVLLR